MRQSNADRTTDVRIHRDTMGQRDRPRNAGDHTTCKHPTLTVTRSSEPEAGPGFQLRGPNVMRVVGTEPRLQSRGNASVRGAKSS